MYKKSVALFATLFCFAIAHADHHHGHMDRGGYPASQGYQTGSESDAVRKQKLDSLNQQLKDLTQLQNSLINNNTITFPRALLMGSAVAGIVAAASVGNGNIGPACGSGVACVVLGVMAKGSSDAEEQKRQELSEQIQQTTKAIAAV